MAHSSQSVPLMSDQDFELGRDLPSYEETMKANKNQQKTESQKSTTKGGLRIDGRGGANHFWSDLGQKREDQQSGGIGALFSKHIRQVDEHNSVALAQLHIRLGIFNNHFLKNSFLKNSTS